MFGLLGKSLSHSLSKTVHTTLNPDMAYHLYETDDVAAFLSSHTFKGINVTIPYKQTVRKHLDKEDDSVRKTGVVNTVVNQDGTLIGYNTDFLALKSLLPEQLPNNLSSKIGILGNGATMRSVRQALFETDRRNIAIYARNPQGSEWTFSEIDPDTDVLINTTPVGMYPDNDARLPIDLDAFHNLKLIIDLIYNPLRTNLMLDGTIRNIKTYNGLPLLIKQAALTQEIFFGKAPTYALEALKVSLDESLRNFVLIGLSFSGKSHYARILESMTGKKLIDVDWLIGETENMSVADIFQQKGESYFRDVERRISLKHARDHGQIIATGAGVIHNDAVIRALKQNGILIHLDLDERLIERMDLTGRPLIKAKSDWLRHREARDPLYKLHADLIIKKDTLDETVILKRIEEAIHAYLNR